ncbi:hypothetical protein ACWDA9_28675, partial [Streptomyces sp. NPDC001193]
MDLPDFGIPQKLASRMSMAEQHDYLRAKFTRRGALRAGAVTAAYCEAWLGRHGQSPRTIEALWDLVGIATLN